MNQWAIIWMCNICMVLDPCNHAVLGLATEEELLDEGMDEMDVKYWVHRMTCPAPIERAEYQAEAGRFVQ